MPSEAVLVHDPTTSRAVEAVVDAFIELRERNRGSELAAVLTDDAVLDLNVPGWRFQVGGSGEIAEVFAAAFASGFRTEHRRIESTRTGAVVEYDGWDVARGTYHRQVALVELRAGQIARLTVYCTGAWDERTVERQRREAPMVDRLDEPTGAAR